MNECIETITAIQGRKLETLFARFPDHRLSKYFDWRRHSMEATERAIALGLDASPRPLDILDLGGGLGYFAAACCSMGHRVCSLEIEHDLPRRAYSILGVRMVGHAIQCDTPLPDSRLCDLITMYRVNLWTIAGSGIDLQTGWPDHKRFMEIRWGWPEYERFANEQILPHLRVGGRWHIDPNVGETGFILDADHWKETLGDRIKIFRTDNSITIKKTQ